MFLPKLRYLFRWPGLSVALGVVVLHPPSEAAAQVVAGHSIGEDRGKLDGVAWQNSFGGYVDGKFKAANGVEVSATSEQSTGKLVRLHILRIGLVPIDKTFCLWRATLNTVDRIQSMLTGTALRQHRSQNLRFNWIERSHPEMRQRYRIDQLLCLWPGGRI